MFNAVVRGNKARRWHLYDYERPIAQQSALLANQQRDPKKQQKPFSMDDFAIYKPIDADGTPSGAYGSAMVALVKAKRCPPWALFCYKQLSQAANPDYIPAQAALVADQAVLLHPIKTPDGYKGLLIATEAASDKRLVFRSMEGQQVTLNVPTIPTKVIAEEDVVLLS